MLAVGDESVVLAVPGSFHGGDGWELVADNAFVHRRLLERLQELQGGGETGDELLRELLDPDP